MDERRKGSKKKKGKDRLGNNRTENMKQQKLHGVERNDDHHTSQIKKIIKQELYK